MLSTVAEHKVVIHKISMMRCRSEKHQH